MYQTYRLNMYMHVGKELEFVAQFMNQEHPNEIVLSVQLNEKDQIAQVLTFKEPEVNVSFDLDLSTEGRETHTGKASSASNSTVDLSWMDRITEALHTPIFNRLRAIMGTENFAQDVALLEALTVFVKASGFNVPANTTGN